MYLVTPDVNIFIGAAAKAWGLPMSRPDEPRLRAVQDDVYRYLGDSDRFGVASSDYLLRQVRSKLQGLGAPHAGLDIWTAELRNWLRILEPGNIPDVVPNDFDDNNVVAVALRAREEASVRGEPIRAHLIVSTDRHLIEMEEFDGVQVLSAGAFVRVLTRAAPLEHEES